MVLREREVEEGRVDNEMGLLLLGGSAAMVAMAACFCMKAWSIGAEVGLLLLGSLHNIAAEGRVGNEGSATGRRGGCGDFGGLGRWHGLGLGRTGAGRLGWVGAGGGMRHLFGS